AERRALAIAVRAHGQHLLLIGLDHVHADHGIALAQLDPAHAARVATHASGGAGMEADRHSARGADDDVLPFVTHARREQLIALRQAHADDAAHTDVLVRAERRALDRAAFCAGDEIIAFAELLDRHDRGHARAGFEPDEVHERAAARRARSFRYLVHLLQVGD